MISGLIPFIPEFLNWKIVRTSCSKTKGVFRFKVSNQPYLVNQSLQPY